MGKMFIPEAAIHKRIPPITMMQELPAMVEKGRILRHVMEAEEPDLPDEPFLRSLATKAGALYSSPAAQLNRHVYDKWLAPRFRENVQLQTLKGL